MKMIFHFGKREERFIQFSEVFIQMSLWYKNTITKIIAWFLKIIKI